jgi:glucokinase
MDLIADIGATNSRCALLDKSGRIVRTENFRNAGHSSLEALLRHFLGSTVPARAALAIAGPITGDTVALLNIDWQFSQTGLATALGTETLLILNDFEALAHALPKLTPADCHAIGKGHAVPGATMAVLGPGSGLGVSTAAADGDSWTAVGGEGGHVTVPTLSATEALLIADHGDQNGHCSAERLLSGPGLVRIYSSLARRAGLTGRTPRPVTPEAVTRAAITPEATTVESVTPAAITERAALGDPIAVATYDAFFALLGTVAGNLALTVGAHGGVFIAGGIVPRVIARLEQSDFRERFVGKGRYRDYLDAIPTSVITIERPAFLGLISVLGLPGQ